LEGLVGAELAAKVTDAAEAEAALAGRDRQNLDELRRRLRRKPLIEVPVLPGDVHDLEGLWRMEEHLFDR
jgi:short-subunit dehydrogenase